MKRPDLNGAEFRLWKFRTAVHVMSWRLAMGEVAGLVAALSAKEFGEFRKMGIEQLQIAFQKMALSVKRDPQARQLPDDPRESSATFEIVGLVSAIAKLTRLHGDSCEQRLCLGSSR